ncbi:NAD(P)-dependent alcohol dehydrogenase [Gemmata sp. JC717]|uniref:zinc-dependent alcohol dehydrogenase family protein n=1 Tax=Gemmata algarum TaxID=2975278 RepID=UPI0021BA54E0|nr:NAD(P)-dependent alcohol dehydrogenase [Gemmata algarum]MDY3551693.1 NAD(P)-dependent alcohol dehydrogenase [Gemmata algarum]
MKALVLRGGFGSEHLALEERPEPAPGPGEVLVRVRAASLNFRDLMLVKGQYNPKLALPRVMGSDAAGEVVAAGAGVTRFKPGDRVANTFMPLWEEGAITGAAAGATYGSERDGVFAEVIAVHERALVAVPPHLSYEEAATLPCAAVTAWNALTAASTGPGTTVLLQGTGGVSIFALQLATVLGARALITSSSDDKLARAARLGAAAGVNYRTDPDWDKWARQQTGGAGADVVIEVGGAGTLDRSIRAVKTGGHVAVIGVLTGGGTVNPVPVLMKAVRLQGVFVGSRAMFEEMNRVITEKQIRPVIDRAFPFADAVNALRHMESGSHFGKVVLSMTAPGNG